MEAGACERVLPVYPSGETVDPARVAFMLQMIERNVNAPLTSSCGRLFDAVAALIGLRARVTHEAQAAIALEMSAMISDDAAAYPFEVRAEADGPLAIGTEPLFRALLDDRARGVRAADIARRFHNGLVDALAQVATQVRRRTALDRVCLSGGCFQNRTLLEALMRRLQADGFTVFTHREIPCGDGGLSLGQALVAAHTIRAS
jgi:hydrogenase maturation protein HypF